MIGKGRAIAHGGNAINYALREGKMDRIVGRNMIESDNPADILREFEKVNQHNYRCKNKYLRFEIGIAPQDKDKLTNADIGKIARTFAKRMGLENHQWIACTHKDTKHPHVHLIANRIGVDGKVFDTTFVSNRSAKLTEEISREMGLTIANEVPRQKPHQEEYSDPARQQAKDKLQQIAYAELRGNKTLEGFLHGLERQGVDIEAATNKKGNVYGIRFNYEGHTFKASEIGREFGYHKIFKELNPKIKIGAVFSNYVREKEYLRDYRTVERRQEEVCEEIKLLDFISETHFKCFLMIIRSAGFISPKLLRSRNAINFAYILYLTLKSQGTLSDPEIASCVNRWLVYSILTGRYSGSPESVFDYDIKQITQRPIQEYIQEKEAGELSDAFWHAALPQSMDTSVASSPYFHVFLAAQVKLNDKGFLSRDITVEDLISFRGDIHHLFPKDYLKRRGLPRGRYNQIANYVYMQSEINIRIGNKSPKEYLELINKKIETGDTALTGISTPEELARNLEMNSIPASIVNMTIEDYDNFLLERRKLMALKIRDYYFSL